MTNIKALEFTQQRDSDGSPAHWESQASETEAVYAVSDSHYPREADLKYVLGIGEGLELNYEELGELIEELQAFREEHPPHAVRPYAVTAGFQPEETPDGSTRWTGHHATAPGFTAHVSAEPDSNYYRNRHYWLNITPPAQGYNLAELQEITNALAEFTTTALVEHAEYKQRIHQAPETA